jgi:carboxypeptidase Taq
MDASSERALSRLKEIDSEIHVLSGASALLGWDQETYMPRGGLANRGEQSALLEGLAHDRLASAETAALLAALGCADAEPSGDPSLPRPERLYLRAFHRAWARAAKLPGEFVRERAKAVAHSQAAWAEAREKNDFPSFEPHFQAMIAFARREAAYLGFERDPYSGLLNQYEPGMTEAPVAAVFEELKAGLASLLSRIGSRPQIDDSFLHRHCPEERQEAFSRRIAGILGLDPGRSRLDRSAHPFTTTIGPGDVRITTRYLEDYFASSISSTIHETGHALYEQGLPEAWFSTMAGDAASMAVHESQSRFWENVVGRSLAFWKARLPELRECVGPALDGIGPEEFYRAMNKVEPGLIRVDADEVTYSLHIVLRFELESALVSGALEPSGVPSAWKAAMERILGIVPADDAMGCLQDIHWSLGLVGYFPSYALGNLYAAQFAERMDADLGGIEAIIERGEQARLLDWLRRKVHSKGSLHTPSEIVADATGAPLSPKPFLEYLERKYAGIYGFSTVSPPYSS